MLKRIASLLIIICSLPLMAEESDPKAMLETVADRIITYVKDNKQAIENDENVAVELVKRELLPIVNRDSFAKRVLGKKEWMSASEQQRSDFIDGFTQMVINTYASGIAKYDGQTFEFADTRFSKSGKTAMVHSEMKQNQGAPVAIDYRLTKDDNDWKVIDLVVEGISMVNSYRSQFSQELQKSDLDTVIAKLKNNELKLADNSES